MSRRSVVTSLAVLVALSLGFAGGWLTHQSSRASRSNTPAISSKGGAATEATISGHLLAVGGPGGVPPRPLRGSISVAVDAPENYASGGFHLLGTQAGSDGSYSISVPPGTYSVTGSSPQYNGGGTTCFSKGVVTVTQGTAVVVNVLCQEK